MNGFFQNLISEGKKNEKSFSGFLALLMVFCLAMPRAALSEAESAAPAVHEFTREEKTMYVFNDSTTIDLPLFFLSDAPDLPYIEITALLNLISQCAAEMGHPQFLLRCEPDEADEMQVLISRENGYTAVLDMGRGTLVYKDYDAFVQTSAQYSLIDIVSFNTEDDAQESIFQRIDQGTFDRYGKELEVDLAAYGINLYYDHENKAYFVPFKLMFDLLAPAALSKYTVFYHDGTPFLASRGSFLNGDDTLTPMGELFENGNQEDRSEALADYSYRELCLELDLFYGLKGIHGIQSFDVMFTNEDFKGQLLSQDALDADTALASFIENNLDDLHSDFVRLSPCSDGSVQVTPGRSYQHMTKISRYFLEAREQLLGSDIPFYQEVGSTAYITFDEFDLDYLDYYGPLDNAPANDLVANVIRAHQQIMRADSPVENVVIDLSCNDGGAVDAATFLMDWITGDVPITVQNTMTGASSTATYRADVDLNHVFDENDTLAGKKVYCLISPLSFSCGNLVPLILQEDPRITLIGQTSGGGSCLIKPMATAYGSMFQISSPYRLSLVKNGSLYDVDRGVDPDIQITRIEHFYDREALNAFLAGLY